jgi:hypothetical protein
MSSSRRLYVSMNFVVSVNYMSLACGRWYLDTRRCFQSKGSTNRLCHRPARRRYEVLSHREGEANCHHFLTNQRHYSCLMTHLPYACARDFVIIGRLSSYRGLDTMDTMTHSSGNLRPPTEPTIRSIALDSADCNTAAIISYIN